jgi:competence protein ComEA
MSKDAWKVAFGVLCGLLSAGIILLASSPPRGEAVTLLPPPSPEPIQVHVAGAVAEPGLYHLPINSRVEDAIQAAGGFLSQADSQSLNLAAFLADGSRVVVPYQPTEIPEMAQRLEPIEVPISGMQTPDSDHPININIASQEELESLPGIGPVTAAKIIDYRDLHGPFATIEAIQDVSGIGPKTFEQIKALITVGITP